MCEVPFVSCRLLRQGSSFNCAFVPNHFRAQLTAALLLHRNFLVTQRVSCRTLCNAQTPRARSPGDMPARHSTSGCCWNNTRPVVTGWTPLRRLQPHRQSWCRYAIVQMIPRKFACPVIAHASAAFHLHTCICISHACMSRGLQLTKVVVQMCIHTPSYVAAVVNRCWIGIDVRGPTHSEPCRLCNQSCAPACTACWSSRRQVLLEQPH